MAQPPIIQLRISDQDPYVYQQPSSSGSLAIGTDNADSSKLKIIMSNAIDNIDPSSGTIAAGSCSMSIDPSTNGNIEFCPQGSGQTNFARGSVSIEGQSSTAGNLLMVNTTAAGLSGVIEFGGDRFIHKYGTNNTFIGDNAGNFNVGIGARNVAVGPSALTNVGSAGPTSNNNVGIGYQALTALTGNAGNNIAIGTSTLASTTLDYSNVAIGTGALQSLNGGGAGIANIALGVDAGQNIGSGEYNVLIGVGTGTAYTTSESSNIIIGNVGTISESNQIRIGTQGSGIQQQNQCNIAGIYGSSVTAAGMVVVDTSGNLGSQALPTTAPILAWSVITTSPTSAVNNGYICNHSGTVTVTLPATAAVGTLFGISGMNNATGWQLAQNAGQQIFFGTSSTTSGATGSLASSATYDTVTMICNVANTSWIVVSSIGNITVH